MRTKQDRFEIPAGTGYQGDQSGYGGPSGRRPRSVSLRDDKTLWDAHRQPDNEYEALMQCDFDQEPAELPDGSFLAETMACLTEKEQAVINFVVIGQMSYRDAGRVLGAEFPRHGVPKPYGKTCVGNIYNRAIKKMRKMLEEQDD